MIVYCFLYNNKITTKDINMRVVIYGFDGVMIRSQYLLCDGRVNSVVKEMIKDNIHKIINCATEGRYSSASTLYYDKVMGTIEVDITDDLPF